MNLTNLLAGLYGRLNFTATPPAATTTRLTGFINEAHRQILAMPGMERLRDSTTSFASVASVGRYALPPAVARIKAIGDQLNQRRLRFLAADQFRTLDPGVTGRGTPDWWIPISYAAVAVQQPITATGLWAVSSSASDTARIVFVESIRTGGYPFAGSVTLNGTTRVQIGTLTDHVEVTKFYLSAATAGFISLFDAAVAGNELARIAIGQTYARYLVIQLYPTPTAAVTYYVDFTRVIADMANAGDEPLLPEDFHYLLILGALRREYQKSDDTRWQEAVIEEQQGIKALRNWVLFPPDYDAVPGVRPVEPSNLGPFFPRGVWLWLLACVVSGLWA